MTLRLVVTGREGQVARALAEAGAVAGITVVCLARPELDLERPDRVVDLITAARPDVVINAAAHTAVDQAESEPERAMAVNAAGAGAVAAAAATVRAPVIQLSTDYVFDGLKRTSYVEDDPVAPTGAYGLSKLAGERAVMAATADHAILRTAWVYAPFGKNFVRTMLRLGAARDEVGVVSDQIGCPTYAPDIADGILAVARNLVDRPGDPALRGIFHMAGAGETTWAGLAEAIFAIEGLPVRVRPIATADYPTPARRPANSRLDCAKLAGSHGLRLPDWRSSLAACLDRLRTGPD